MKKGWFDQHITDVRIVGILIGITGIVLNMTFWIETRCNLFALPFVMSLSTTIFFGLGLHLNIQARD